MPENYDYPLNIWDFADNSGSWVLSILLLMKITTR